MTPAASDLAKGAPRHDSRPQDDRGFTLIELMIVVAIIGILAAIAVPKFAELIRKSNEGATKGNLGALRSALSIYYADMEGLYPDRISSLTTGGKYLSELPYTRTWHHEPRNVETRSANFPNVEYASWWYNNDPTHADFGALHVNCSHTDTRQTVWSSY